MRKVRVLITLMIVLISANAFCMDIDNLAPVLDQAKKSIDAVLSSIDKDISTAAKQLSVLDLKSEAARKILEKLCENRTYVIDCAIIDMAGKMAMVEPAKYHEYEGSDISNQEHIIALLKDKKPILTGVFNTIEGVKAVDFEYPIFSAAGDLLGSISMLVKQESLTGDIISPLVSYLPSKIWVMQKNGVIIYDADSNQIGMNIFKDEFFQPFQQLISFSTTVSLAKDGGGSYDFYTKGMDNSIVVKKYAVWDTVSLYGTEWRIIVMEADQPEQK